MPRKRKWRSKLEIEQEKNREREERKYLKSKWHTVDIDNLPLTLPTTGPDHVNDNEDEGPTVFPSPHQIYNLYTGNQKPPAL